MAERDVVKIVQQGYAFDVPCIELGALVVDGKPRSDAKIRVPWACSTGTTSSQGPPAPARR